MEASDLAWLGCIIIPDGGWPRLALSKSREFLLRVGGEVTVPGENRGGLLQAG